MNKKYIKEFNMLKRNPYNLILEILYEYGHKRVRFEHLKFVVCEKYQKLPIDKREKYLTFFEYMKNSSPILDRNGYEIGFWLSKNGRQISGIEQENKLNGALSRLIENDLIKKNNDKSSKPYYIPTLKALFIIEHIKLEDIMNAIVDYVGLFKDKVSKKQILELRKITNNLHKKFFVTLPMDYEFPIKI